MGRPLKGYYFGKYNSPYGASGVGGEALYSNGTGNLTVTFGNVGTGYYSANVGATISAPTVAGGVTAVVDQVYLDTNGNIEAVHVSNAGSGYVAPATITFTGANTYAASGTANTNPVSTSANAIVANAWVTGGTVGKLADIVKQVGGKSYRVQNADGTDVCKLVTTATPQAAGEMTITATFVDANTFSVAKLTDNLAYDSTGASYMWADFSSTTGTVTYLTASNSTTPFTVSIANR